MRFLLQLSYLSKVLCTVGLFLAPIYAHAQIAHKLHGPVSRFIEQAHISHVPFLADKGKKVGYLKWTAKGKLQDQPALVIVPGRGEIAYLWAETAYDLRELGFSGNLYIWDPPGQGLSDRLLVNMADVGHIRKFSDYCQSFADFLQMVRKETGHAPRLIAHSMGGTISLLVLKEQPELAQDLILAAPMLGIGFVGRFYPLARLLTSWLDSVPLLRQVPFRRVLAAPAHAHVNGTSLGDRLAFRHELKTKFSGYIPGKTIRWMAEANRAIVAALDPSQPLQVPTLLLVAGKDEVVKLPEDKMLRLQFGGSFNKQVIENARHSMHEEDDLQRSKFIGAISGWLELPLAQDRSTLERLGIYLPRY